MTGNLTKEPSRTKSGELSVEFPEPRFELTHRAASVVRQFGGCQSRVHDRPDGCGVPVSSSRAFRDEACPLRCDQFTVDDTAGESAPAHYARDVRSAGQA